MYCGVLYSSSKSSEGRWQFVRDLQEERLSPLNSDEPRGGKHLLTYFAIQSICNSGGI